MRQIVPVWAIALCGCSLVVEAERPALEADAALPSEVCGSSESDVFRFEAPGDGSDVSSIWPSSTGGYGATVEGHDFVQTASGPKGCGRSLLFEDEPWLELAHDPAFELAQATLSFWYYPSTLANLRGVISKDGDAEDTGHMTVFQQPAVSGDLAAEGVQLVIRTQVTGGSSYLCSEPLGAPAWHHVVIVHDDGKWQGWVDGTLMEASGVVDRAGQPSCDTGGIAAGDLTGNLEDWVFGGSGESRPTYDVRRPLGADGRLAHIRLRAGIARP